MTGHTVNTGIETDEASFHSVPGDITYFYCPHCPAPHRMSSVETWLVEGDGKSPSTNKGCREADAALVCPRISAQADALMARINRSAGVALIAAEKD